MTATTRVHCLLLLAASGCLAAVLLTSVHCAHRQASVPAAAKAQNQEPRKLYGRTIVVPDGSAAALREAAHAMAGHLSRATGVRFEVTTQARQGIHFLRSDAPDVPAEVASALRGQGREAYFVRSEQGRLLIVANADDGLIFGGYQFLERLRFRFYFPSDKWTIVPPLKDIELRLEGLVKPAFLRRRFSGTGGFGKGLALDPKGSIASRWATWKLQNGFGQEFHVAGHAGEAFNVRNKHTLLAHPEYLAMVDGQRVPWSKTAKLDPSNPEAVSLFVRDRVQAYRDLKKRDPDGPGSFAVSVEPADGGGHCNSPACLRIGGPSEQQFYLANAVARALSEEFPGAHASLFAYNFHADVPRIAIEPNVYVTLIPYAFRRTGSAPERFIKEWAAIKSPLGIYDYWSIPDWVADTPVFDYRHTPAKKLRFWRAQGIEAFAGETTYSAGAMGLGWYIAGHLMWDPARDPEQLASEFLRDAFGTAEPAMRRMLERWAAGFLLTRAELHTSFADLADALSRARSPEVTARLVDYAGYVQYLRLRYEWLNASDTDERPRKRALLSHIWRMHDSAMLHTFRLQKLLVRRDKELAAEFDSKAHALPIWKKLKPLTLAEAKLIVQAGSRDYPKTGLELKVFAGELVPAVPGDENGGAAAGSTITLVGSNRLELLVPESVPTLDIEISSDKPLRASLLGAQQQEVAASEVGPTATPKKFAVPIPRAGGYWLDLRVPKHGVVTVSVPAGVGVELQEFRVPKRAPAPDLYFFVPRGETRVALHSRSKFQIEKKGGPVLFDASGRQVPTERSDGGHVMIASVPAGQDGKVWVLRRAVAPTGTLKLLNAPQRFALSARALRVPASVLKPRPHGPSAGP